MMIIIKRWRKLEAIAIKNKNIKDDWFMTDIIKYNLKIF